MSHRKKVLALFCAQKILNFGVMYEFKIQNYLTFILDVTIIQGPLVELEFKIITLASRKIRSLTLVVYNGKLYIFLL